MGVKRTRKHRAATLVLACLVYSAGLSGCGETAQEAAPGSVETKALIASGSEVCAGNIRCDALTEKLTVTDADMTQLAQVLPQLSQLKILTLEGRVPALSQLADLKTQYPALELIFKTEIAGQVVSSDCETLDLTNAEVSLEELREALPLFSRLKELTLGSSLTDEEKMTLCRELEGVLVRCQLPLGGQYFSTDSTEIDISNCPVTIEEVEAMLPCFPGLKKLDMSFCGISNEDMDALKQRHPETGIVWTVVVGEVKVRTDAIYFYPAESNYYPTNAEMENLRYCTELIAVDIGHTRATDCEFLWYTPNVRYLILADTGITDITPVGNLKELIYLEIFNLKTKDYSPLLNCTKLQDLNIGTTHADPEPLSKMTWLHNLQWHRADTNPETKEAVLKLPEQLPDTNVELYPKKKARNIGGGWRYIPNYYVFRDIIGATYFNQDQIGDYWGEEDAKRIMACESGKSYSGLTLAQIVRERIENGEPIIGLKDNSSQKAEILYQTLLEAEKWAKR